MHHQHIKQEMKKKPEEIKQEAPIKLKRKSNKKSGWKHYFKIII